MTIGRAAPRARRHGGRGGFRALLEEIPLRISVSGIRGKSGLTLLLERELRARGLSTYAKITGSDPASIRNGRAHPIERGPGRVSLDETRREIQRHRGAGIDALVLENQAITPYTMSVFNRLFCRPHYLLVTNVRRDHLGDISRTLPGLARAFGRSATEGCTIVSGEQDPDLNGIIGREAARASGRFVVAARGPDDVPGAEALDIADVVLAEATGSGLAPETRAAELARLRAHFSWRVSSLPRVAWFDGSEINDVDSTRAVHRYLQSATPLPTAFVAYFRRDRVDRTASFVEFFETGFSEGWCERAYLAGFGATAVARRLRRWSSRVRVFDDDIREIPYLIDFIAIENRGGAVMTVGNGVPAFARALTSALTARSVRKGA